MFNHISSILPKAIKRTGLGRKIREAEVLELFERLADEILPGDLRASAKAMYSQGGYLSIASLSGYATRELKRKEAYIIQEIKKQIPEARISKIRFLA